MNATRTTAVAIVAAGLAATACATDRTPATVITVAPAPPATVPVEPPLVLDLPNDIEHDDDTEEPVDEPIDTTDAVEVSDEDPPGTVVQIAIRYLNALRAGRWYAAVNDMTLLDRTLLDLDDAPSIGREVLRNARGNRATLPRCTSGERFTEKVVAVRCGTVNVVIHVKTRNGFRGVAVSEWHVEDDHYARPHTHAYSTRV